MKNSNGFIFVLLVLCILGGVLWFSNSNQVVPNDGIGYQDQDIYQEVKDEEIVEKKNEEVDQSKTETKVILNSQVYNFTDSSCHIGVGRVDGKDVGSFSILLKNDEVSSKRNIFFVTHNSGNTIESYLQKNVNLSDNGIKISNNLDSSSYSTGIIDGVEVVWNNIKRENNTFSGDGYIKFNKEIKPHQDVCDGKTTVNQKYLTPSDPFYAKLCPSDIFPVQTIYFKCDNGVINTRIGIIQTS